ncbi:ATP-binding protein [Thalassospira sp. CH_XMU1448-2]|uniref:ATP-binding protein n=1 Tax=Thalassospira sp. CH_XMU1448-2 TaxID=3107773 RepID=UPI00300AB590
MSKLINEPDASRLIFGLRDTGYNFRTAAADIIDNAIAANADTVNVRVDLLADGRKFVFFGDDGDGMDENGVHAALRYGAPVRENLASLGKFGLGLKTASSSVCRNFVLISRQSKTAPLTKLGWDLDHVEETGCWEMRNDPIEAHEHDAFEELCGDKGTLVVWSKCDRILAKNYDEPGGTKEQQAIRRLRKSLVEHLSLIYHRFLDPEDARERLIKMSVNDEAVEAWNPFYPEKSEQVLSVQQQLIPMESVDGEDIGSAKIKAWLLPHSNDLSPEEKGKARLSNKGQGFYIYREGRLINEGGWLGLFTLEPHYSMLRIEFDFDHELDEAFYVDVKKSRILFDPSVEEYLTELLKNARREANNRSRRKQQAAAVAATINHTSANVSIGSTPNTKKPTIESVDIEKQTAVVTNNHGSGIRIKQPIQNNVPHNEIYVGAVDTITSGNLWVPVLRSEGTAGHVPGVELNKHHDFYQKVYLRAGASGYSVQGMDLLLWALAASETDFSNEEMAPIFEDIREVVSSNLRKLLRDVPLPDSADLKDDIES